MKILKHIKNNKKSTTENHTLKSINQTTSKNSFDLKFTLFQTNLKDNKKSTFACDI